MQNKDSGDNTTAEKEANMKERNMTVYRGSTKDYEPVPKITIQGKWLDELGFCIGDKLTVTCKEGELVIVKAGCRTAEQA